MTFQMAATIAGASANAWIWVVMQALFTSIWGWTLVSGRLLSGQRAS